ncbi:MAG: 30S ribosomal protein S8 [Deltaproteobacteria bacterium RBG_16_71_12]|nr:MAG: 30S ribosomal protein S8 [Deltaproteobacteria bacterium RBG_16_71_12]
MTDPIADFLTRIRNGLMARHKTVVAPSSKLKHRIAQILADEGYVADVRIEPHGGRPMLSMTLRYDEQNSPMLDGIERVSRPGLRRYAGADDLAKVRGGIGMAILSTSKGVMTDRQARLDRVGGEVLCNVW